MTALKISWTLVLLGMVSACGGGASSSSNTASVASYHFVAPQFNSQRTYSEVIIDNSLNTINLTYTQTVTADNANGSYVILEQDPSNNSITMNGTTYSIQPATITLNNSGQELSSTSNTTQVTCVDTPFGAGPTFPITIGENWSDSYSITCGSTTPINYAQTGSVLDVESVTVPAGTYTSLKLQSTLTYTDANGTIRSQFFTTWRDASTGVMVKRQILDTYSGTAITNGYPISTTIVLQSGAP